MPKKLLASDYSGKTFLLRHHEALVIDSICLDSLFAL